MIIPSLNPLGRFGHQFHNYLSSYLLSKFFGVDIAKCGLVGNSSSWNDYISLPGVTISNNKKLVVITKEGGLMTKEHLKFYYRVLNDESNNYCIKPPIDQWANRRLMMSLPMYRDEVRNMLVKRKKLINQIAVHIRRGDVSDKKSTSLYTSDARYAAEIVRYHSRYPEDWPICIYSEGSVEQFASLMQEITEKTKRDVIYRIAETTFCTDPCLDFLEMIASRALFCSYSTYAYCAIYFSSIKTDKYFIADKRSSGEDSYSLDIYSKFGAEILADI